MGGGKETKKTNTMIDQDRAAAAGEHKNYMGAVNTGLAGSQGRAQDMYDVQYGGFKDFAEGKYNYGAPALGAGGGGGGGGGAPASTDTRFGEAEGSYRNFLQSGGVDPSRFNTMQGNLEEIGRTGGWNPDRVESMNQNIKGFKDIAASGGVDAAGQARMRGGGIFEEFAKEGGLSQGDRTNLRARGNSTIPSFYKTMQDESNRMGAVQGGYGPGRAALAGRMSRDQAAAGADAARNTELGITEQVNKGRMWGGENLAGSESALQGLMSGNRMNALGGAVNAESGMVNSIAQQRTGASNAGAGNEVGMQGLVQKGKMWGTEGLQGMAEADASRAASSAAQAASNGRWEADFNRDSRMMGLEGMQSMYGMKPGEVDMYLGANRSGRDLAYGQQGQSIDQRLGNNPKTDWVGLASGIMGGAGGMMGGMGAMGIGKQPIKTARGGR